MSLGRCRIIPIIALTTILALSGTILAADTAASGEKGTAWLTEGTDPVRLHNAIQDGADKLPEEFTSRLRHAQDGLLRVIVAVDRRDARVEDFVAGQTTWVKWYFDNPRFYAAVTQDQLAALLESPAVGFIEPDVPLTYFLSSSTLDVHARSNGTDGQGVWSYDPEAGPLGALRSDVPGLTVEEATGKGVTVAITDSGIDRTHRDFGGWDCTPGPFQPCDSRIVKAVTTDHMFGTGFDPGDSLPTTEIASGHGTHVAGIVGGNGYYGRDGNDTGAADVYGGDGIPIGVAPQSNLIMTKNGDTLWAGLSSFALEWQLDNAEEYGIKVSSNSWGCVGGCSFNGNSATGRLFRDMYQAGILVTFAVGNDGGNDSGTRFSGYAQSPYVLGVASYDDTNHRLASTSSRGSDKTLPAAATWTPESEPVDGERRPDVAAPGVNIWAARTLTGGAASLVPRASTSDVTGGQGCCIREYAGMGGTSMAAPHVSGAAALAFSACPTAKPLDAMRAIMATAETDILKSSGTGTAEAFEVGYGGLEVRAAVDWLLARDCDSANPGPDDPDPTPTETATPTPTETETPPPTGDGTTYYLHSPTGLGNADWPLFGSSFDTDPPTFEAPARWHDLPFILNGTTGQGPFDPNWTGAVEGQIDALTVDFWAKTPVGDLLGEVHYEVRISADGRQSVLPRITQEIDPQIGNAPSRITKTFTTMLDDEGAEVPLSIDPAGQPVTLTIRGVFIDAEAGAWIVYDSIEEASSFTVHGGESSEPVDTTVAFTENSAESAEYSDTAELEAVLTDDTDAPLAGEELVFELSGDSGSREIAATTDETGTASETITIDQEPGSYMLMVRFAGDDENYNGSADTRAFVVDRESTDMTLESSGISANDKTLTATLVDHDDAEAGVEDRVITFTVGDQEIGTARTDEDGVAVFEVPKRYAGGPREYTATFAGDEFYRGSSATTGS